MHGVLYVENDEFTAPVEQEIRDLSSGLQLVKDEQSYLVVRERTHRNSESNPPPSNGPTWLTSQLPNPP